MDEDYQSDSPVFDHADFLERVDSDMDLARQVGQMFLEDACEKIAAIRELIERREAGELANAAHSLKGASANMSALRLRRIAADIEQAAKNDDIAGAQEMFVLVEKAFDEFASELKRHGLA